MANEQNLKPFKPGYDSRREGNGRPKGLRNWSTVVKELLADEEFFNTILASTTPPAFIKNLKNKNAGTAIVAVMSSRALAGDQRAAEWLRKTGYGDKLELTGDIEISSNRRAKDKLDELRKLSKTHRTDSN